MAAKAKQAQLEAARAKNPANDPQFAERQAARLAAAEARETRQKERKAERLAEAKRKNFDITPSSGEDLATLAKQVMTQTPELIARAKRLMEQ